MLESGGQFDVIIDDASHVSRLQQFAFFKLWPEVKKGGIYVIEDINFSRQPFWEPWVLKMGHLKTRKGNFEMTKQIQEMYEETTPMSEVFSIFN